MLHYQKVIPIKYFNLKYFYKLNLNILLWWKNIIYSYFCCKQEKILTIKVNNKFKRNNVTLINFLIKSLICMNNLKLNNIKSKLNNS